GRAARGSRGRPRRTRMARRGGDDGGVEGADCAVIGNRIARTGAGIAVAAGLLCSQAPVTLRTETRVVQIDVEVRDARGQPVAGLSKDDFTVTDNGKPREIQIFSVEGNTALPRDGPPLPALPPNVFSNHSPAARRPSHATVILLDAINNYWDDFAAARLRLLAIVDKLHKDERIAV